MSQAAPKPRVFLLEIVFLLAAMAAAATWGYLSIEAWTRDGLFPGARTGDDFWPTWMYAQLGLLLLFSFRTPPKHKGELVEGRGAASLGHAVERLAGLALALTVWAMSVEFATELGAFPSSFTFGGGPILRPFVLLLGLGLGWFAFGGPLPPGFKGRSFVFDHPLGERALVVFAVLCTANGRLFLQTASTGYALLLLAGLVTVVLLGRGHSLVGMGRRLGRAFGLPAALILFGLPIWWLIASVNAASTENAMRLTWRLLVPGMIAALGVATLGRNGIRRVFGGLVLGFGCALFAGLLGVYEALGFCSLEEIFGSRLRILGLHPNLGAALLAIGLPLTVGWMLLGKTDAPSGSSGPSIAPGRRLMGSAIVAVSVCALYLTGSRAGGLGAILGSASFVAFLLSRHTTRLNTRLLATFFAGVAVVLALFFSPLGDSARDALDAKAQTQSALGQRWHIWKMAGDATMANPVLGIGPAGFPGHAQYADPSYYDGSAQVLHSHNIFLAASAGAGFPGLLLFAAWLVCFFGVGLRALNAGGPNRPMFAALLAACLGLLICNLFDLGQSQLTFLPLFFWLTLVLFGADRRLAREQSLDADLAAGTGPEGPATLDPASAPPNGLVLPLLCLILIWPSTVSTLGGIALMDRATASAASGDLEASTAQLEVALLGMFSPDRAEARTRLSGQYEKLGRDNLRIANFEAGVVENPLHAASWRRLAEAQLGAGKFAKGSASAKRAFSLDPRGSFQGGTRMLQAWAAFELGDMETGAELLIMGFAGGAKPPRGMRLVRRDSPLLGGSNGQGDKTKRRKEIYFLGPGDAEVGLDEVLAELGGQLVALAQVDEVRARRELTGLIEGYRFGKNPKAAAPWIRGVIDASNKPIRATFFQEIEVLLEAGDEHAARSVWEGMDLGEDTNLADVFSGFFGAHDAAGELAVSGLDIFFVAGQLVELRLDWALKHVAAGRRAQGEHELERALYDAREILMRTRVAYDFLRQAQGNQEQRLGDLVRFLRYSASTRRGATNGERFNGAIEALAPVFGHDLRAFLKSARAAIDGTGGLGHAGENFLIVLQGEVAKGGK
jgi:O-antigen ligase/tetratricopeptide (TPR) repeat protein